FLHMVAITTLAIPGIVLGLSYMLFFKGSILYGTFAILILVNSMHFFSSPYLMAYNSFEKINSNLEAVGQTMGIGKFQLTKDVFIPQMFGTILEMFSYFFVNSMMTISAVSFLANSQNKPLSLMINLFQAQMILEGAAFVSLAILTINILMKLIVYLLKRRFLNVAAKGI
ncbi:MAG: ABC transporter permease subunit, partial [Treponema sp.]|nr:ABC transporter permease subunit [Treponema sp.]